MSPGGGYSQIPGFMPAIGPPLRRIAFLGQEETTIVPAPNELTPPDTVFIPGPITLIPTPPPVNVQPTTYTAPTTLIPPSTPLAVQNVPFPNLAPSQMYASVPGATVSVTPAFMNRPTLGVPNKYLIAAGAALFFLTSLAGRRRRNPARRRRRAR